MWRPCAFNGTRVHCTLRNPWCKLFCVAIGNGTASQKGKLVVCIEDEQEMIDLVQLILGRRGFKVEGANGGLEGLEKVQQQKPDLVLLDLMMPDMDGWEVYQRMKSDESLRDIPVIVITAKAQSIDKVLGLHIAKVDDYITKPFGPQELLESVEKILGQVE
ncbi:MAG: response regulator [Chloroflexi bacterium]|nr:response regulator [Chloroflexota bacterium]